MIDYLAECSNVRVVGVGEHGATLVADRLSDAVVDVGWGVQAQPGVAVLVVVPGEEDLAVPPGSLD